MAEEKHIKYIQECYLGSWFTDVDHFLKFLKNTTCSKHHRYVLTTPQNQGGPTKEFYF